MRIFRPLRERVLALLFGSQVLSSIGDEMNRVATVWLAAGLWGSRAGFVMALHSGCAFASSLLGGKLAERLDARRTMIAADLLRSAAVAAIPLGLWLGLPLAVLLLLATAVCASLQAFFDPALRASLPTLTRSKELLTATNALMESCARFARVLGPGLVAFAGALIPTVHLFTVDAVTFAASAVAISFVAAHRFAKAAPAEERAGGGGPVAVYRMLSRAPAIKYAVVSGAWVSAAWTFVLPLGMGLLVHERVPEDVTALGAVLTAYGMGNVFSNVLLPNLPIRPERMMFGGRLVAGAGFVAFALAPNTPVLWLSAAVAASGGPAADVGFLGMLQARFEPRELARVYRLNLAASYGAMLLMFFVSPWLVDWLGPAPVIQLCGGVLVALGALGLLRHGGRREAEVVSAPVP